MATISNIPSLIDKLWKRADKLRMDAGKLVVVGYTAPYAVYVHENMQARHKVGQAKFLETPIRELSNSGVLQDIIAQATKQGKTLLEAQYLASLCIQAASQALCPVDTGVLVNSAFTAIEDA